MHDEPLPLGKLTIADTCGGIGVPPPRRNAGSRRKKRHGQHKQIHEGHGRSMIRRATASWQV